MIFDGIEKFGNKIAIYNDHSSVTYSELILNAEKYVQCIPKRSVVVLLCDNSIDNIMMYVGCLRKQIVPIMLDYQISDNMLQNVLKRFMPNYIIVPIKRSFSLTNSRNVYQKVNYLVYEFCSEKHHLYSELALLLTSSGSMGSSKLVRISYSGLNSNCKTICEFLNISETDNAILTLPMSYTYGLSIVNTHLVQGSSLVLLQASVLSNSFWDKIKKFNVTTISGVPYIYDLLDKANIYGRDLSSVRYFTVSGGKISKTVLMKMVDFCEQSKKEFICMYGQVEATARISYLPWNEIHYRLGSIGKAVPGGSMRLVDGEENQIYEPGVVGEIEYTGPNVMLGYAESYKDYLTGDLQNGAVRTGDMAMFDEDGYYYIVGRKRRFVKLAGIRMNLDDLEEMLKNQGYHCACTGKDDQIIICIENGEGEKALAYIRRELRLNTMFFLISPLTVIPRTINGKINYAEIERSIQKNG